MSENKRTSSIKPQSKSVDATMSTATISTANMMGADAASNWATTIGQYLLQRRTQTAQAYQAQLVQSASTTDADVQGWLFEAVFEVLVQRLEEGHTVLSLVAPDTEHGTDDNKADVSIFMWQQQLLQPLLQSLWPVIAATSTATTMVDVSEISVDELLSNDDIWQLALGRSTLPSYDKQVLSRRRQVCGTFYHVLKQLKDQSTSVKNSLSRFNQILNEHPLFTNNTKTTNNTKIIQNPNHSISTPIIFQTHTNPVNKSTQTTLWIQRTWQAEQALAQHVLRIKNQDLTPLPIAANKLLNPEQQAAIDMANQSAFSIITGGPGTGKTFTVAQLVMALQQTSSDSTADEATVNLALAAPTGKAAQRMQESLQAAILHAGVAMALPDAKTIHRLLGIGQGGRPRYHQDNPLSEDIIIVDEASMLGVELANYLVSAVKPQARLILLGDANQLAAVDAGAVLADLCRIPALQDVHQRLTASRRFSDDSGIGQLARLINQPEMVTHDTQHMRTVWQLLQDDDTLAFSHLISGKTEDVTNNALKEYTSNSLSNYKFLKTLAKNYHPFFNKTKIALTKIKKAKSLPATDSIKYFTSLMTLLNQFRVLTAGHHGRCGDHQINDYLSEQHRTLLKLPLSKSPWYHGRPVMVLQNNYELGLFNGDIGICLQSEKGRLQVFFENKNQGININMLSDEMIATAYAMTIHKSQGSEFDHVAIAFDDSNARLLSQELIYTAVTRAKSQVSIFSTASALTQALSTPTMRQTGLALQFEQLVE